MRVTSSNSKGTEQLGPLCTFKTGTNGTHFRDQRQEAGRTDAESSTDPGTGRERRAAARPPPRPDDAGVTAHVCFLLDGRPGTQAGPPAVPRQKVSISGERGRHGPTSAPLTSLLRRVFLMPLPPGGLWGTKPLLSLWSDLPKDKLPWRLHVTHTRVRTLRARRHTHRQARPPRLPDTGQQPEGGSSRSPRSDARAPPPQEAAGGPLTQPRVSPRSSRQAQVFPTEPSLWADPPQTPATRAAAPPPRAPAAYRGGLVTTRNAVTSGRPSSRPDCPSSNHE